MVLAMDLFTHGQQPGIRPLPDRMRPETLDEVVGQEHVLGDGSFLRVAIEGDALPSLILWGVPGCGKTTLARVVAKVTEAVFEPFSAVLGGVKEVREIAVQTAVEADAANVATGKGAVVLQHLKNSSKSQWNRMPMAMEQFRKTKLRNGCCLDLIISMPMAMG